MAFGFMRVSKDEFLAINKAAVPVLKHQEGDAIWLVSVKCNKTVKMHLTKYPTFLQTLSQLIKKLIILLLSEVLYFHFFSYLSNLVAKTTVLVSVGAYRQRSVPLFTPIFLRGMVGY